MFGTKSDHLRSRYCVPVRSSSQSSVGGAAADRLPVSTGARTLDLGCSHCRRACAEVVIHNRCAIHRLTSDLTRPSGRAESGSIAVWVAPTPNVFIVWIGFESRPRRQGQYSGVVGMRIAMNLVADDLRWNQEALQ